MGMKYVILGTSHHVQESSQLVECAEAIIDKYAIDLIAEEYPFDIQSKACALAERRNIPYAQIDLFDNEWAAYGIDWEMKARRDAASLQNDDVRLSHADSIRESFWVDKIEGSLKDGLVLIICGYLHLDFLATNIQARGDKVAEKCTYPPSLLGRTPTKTLTRDGLREYLRERCGVAKG